MALRLNSQIRAIQKSKKIGGNFGAEVAIVARALLDTSNNIAIDPDNLPATLSSIVASAGAGASIGAATDIVTPYTPLTGGTVVFGAGKANETVYLTPAGTLATLTLTFPTDANSRIGQTLTASSTGVVTALTVSSAGLTLLGTAVTALAVNTPVSWRKVAASTWLRIL